MVIIGAIERSFGVQGAMCVRPLTDVPGRFHSEAKVVLIGPRGDSIPVTVTGVRRHGNRLVLSVDGVTSPEAVALFRGGYVYAERTDVAPPPGQYYQCDLIGLTVVDEQGTALGVLDHVMETPAHHVFVVRQGARELMVPAVREWVRRVDVAANIMTVRVPEVEAATDEAAPGAAHAL